MEWQLHGSFGVSDSRFRIRRLGFRVWTVRIFLKVGVWGWRFKVWAQGHQSSPKYKACVGILAFELRFLNLFSKLRLLV